MTKARITIFAGTVAPLLLAAAPAGAVSHAALHAAAPEAHSPLVLAQVDPGEILRRELERRQGGGQQQGIGQPAPAEQQDGRPGRGQQQERQAEEPRREQRQRPQAEQPAAPPQQPEQRAEDPRGRQDMRERMGRDQRGQPREREAQQPAPEQQLQRAIEERQRGQRQERQAEEPRRQQPPAQQAGEPRRERPDLRERMQGREDDRQRGDRREQRAEPSLPERVLEELRIAPAEQRAEDIRRQSQERRRVRERGDNRRQQLDRREVLDERDGRTVIRDGDNRVIIRENNRVIIRNDDDHRLARDAHDIRVERGRNGEAVTTVVRPGGIQIVTTRDEYGNLLERLRRDERGRETVLLSNRRDGRPAFGLGRRIELPPVVINIPRERYVVEVAEAPYEWIEEAFMAPPVEEIERAYTLDEVRQNYRLLEKVRSVDLNTVTFDTGSWDIASDQINRLDQIGAALEEAIARDPDEVFLIEGHTDAVGSNEDNLALSDRRAETVAMILAEYFDIPSENLITQGFGEEQLKVQTSAAERQNRRVVIRRVTPLLTSQR